ncbi:MAG: type I-G CRISPR-associated protein Csb2 [Terriglobales bacterium]
MRLVLQQSFPLGRFHATPWRVNPFDDPYGEWPPSPWRLTRAVAARWYQWCREAAGTWPEDEIQVLIRALCTSDYSFHLPEQACLAVIVRQYQPVEFGWNPRTRKEAGVRAYATTLAQDNAWCIPPDESLFWFVEGGSWTTELADVLARCLERIVYFGRAEALTRIRLTDRAPASPNVKLTERRTSSTPVPVLVPCPDASRADIERVTQERLAARNIPQGARLLYAQRLQRPPTPEALRRMAVRPDTHLVQFALGSTVAPRQTATVRLTARFRTAVLRNLIRIKAQGTTERWGDAPARIRGDIAGMTGKDSRGEPLRGPRAHAEFLLWWDGGIPTRLLVWRGARPFDEEEQEAILGAAAQELSWAPAGPDAEAWKIKLVPLDTAAPPPPGFNGASARTWRTLTPYVPPRHHLRGGKVRRSETVENQIRRELTVRGYEAAARLQSVEEIAPPAWVGVHVPRRQAGKRRFIGDRRGYRLRLCFETPVSGPLILGHSSSFGLGLFVPV